MGTDERQRERARLIEMFAVELIRRHHESDSVKLASVNGPECLMATAAELADALLERAWGR